jgi:hypothetical protein
MGVADWCLITAGFLIYTSWIYRLGRADSCQILEESFKQLKALIDALQLDLKNARDDAEAATKRAQGAGHDLDIMIKQNIGLKINLLEVGYGNDN